MSTTKQKIIHSATILFNEKGLINVRLQHIADRAGISVGNLAYHYPSKKAIVAQIDRELTAIIQPVLSLKQGFLHLIDFDNQLSSYFYLIQRYAFYFLDLLEMERAYPALHAKRRQYIAQMIAQIEQWILLNEEKELIQPELQEGQYHQAALAIWIIITFWLNQQRIRGDTDAEEQAFKTLVWSQLLPLFTETGLLEYRALILPQLRY